MKNLNTIFSVAVRRGVGWTKNEGSMKPRIEDVGIDAYLIPVEYLNSK